jgi:predicted phage terminase large subunit-like protein
MTLSPGTAFAEILSRDFNAFVHRSFLELNGSKTFHNNWHLEMLCHKLQLVAQGQIKRLIINVPPRHLKTLTTSVAFPAWLLGLYPDKQIVCVSYAQDFSDKPARETRQLMQSPFYKRTFPQTRLSTDRQATADFRTTAGGGRFSTSTGGVITGRGGDILIIDDPIKADDALSDAKRTAVNDWFDNSVLSRLDSQEEGAIIIVMQRLHTDDLVGHVLSKSKWDVISFPALAEQPGSHLIETPYGVRLKHTLKGEPLQSTLVSAAKLHELRNAMTSYNFSAQYQQEPQPPQGNIIKRDSIKFYTPQEMPAKFSKIIQSWDTANTVTELSDFSVCTTWGVVDNTAYLLHVFRERLEFPQLKQAVFDLANVHRADLVLVEDKASGTQLIQEFRAARFTKIQAAPNVEGNKILRARVHTAMIENGAMKVPIDADWLDSYIRELTSFPNDKHDDQVDSTTYMLAWLSETSAEPRGFFTHFDDAPPSFNPQWYRM